MPIRAMMRRWSGPIGSRSRRLPVLTDVAIRVSPLCFFGYGAGLLWTRCRLAMRSVQSSLGCRVAIPVERLVVGRDHDALGVEVIVKTFGAELAADAGIIDAAPGGGRIEAMVIVDPDDAGLDAGCHAMRAADVAGTDRRRQPER